MSVQASGRRAPSPRAIRALRLAIASVWLLFGLVFKVFGLLPRHRMIVATFVGEAAAGPVTQLIGLSEALLGVWVLTGVRPRACAAVQTVAIATMNALELTHARELLLAPVLMVCGNVAFLAAAWYVALQRPAAADGRSAP